MTNVRDRIEQAKSRLAQKPQPRHRTQTIAGLVRDLEVDIRQARACGKIWSDIARDLTGDETLRPDSVRLAFSRLRSNSTRSATTKNSQTKQAKSTQGIARSKANSMAAPVLLDAGLFAPMYDAQDTLGRNREEKGA